MGLLTRLVVNGLQRPTPGNTVVALRDAVVTDQSRQVVQPQVIEDPANEASTGATPTPSEETLT